LLTPCDPDRLALAKAVAAFLYDLSADWARNACCSAHAHSIMLALPLCVRTRKRILCTYRRDTERFLAMTNTSSDRVAAVAFCADHLMEAPLHVAVFSLLRHLHTDYSLRLYLVLTGFSAKALSRLRHTLDTTGREYELRLLDTPDPNLFRGFRPLHGNLTPYHRLMLPEMVQDPRLLYLDADMLVRMDVSPLFSLNMESKAMGFVVDSTVEFALEWEFFVSLGMSPQDPAFNSGTMLFDLPEWRRQNCSARVFEFCRRYGNQLASADQTALNALFAKDCIHLDGCYNVKLFPGVDIQGIPGAGIMHYVGSPKPWDIGGKLALPYAKPWWRDLRQCDLPIHQRVPWINYSAWKRLPKILGGYRRSLRESRRSLGRVRNPL
jgi:lipopolysaccharide biosynthesis glycosyltransferase